jgi:hypothetical protein
MKFLLLILLSSCIQKHYQVKSVEAIVVSIDTVGRFGGDKVWVKYRDADGIEYYELKTFPIHDRVNDIKMIIKKN